MKDIIETLYWATIEDSDNKLTRKQKYKDASYEAEKLSTKLKNIMSKRQQNLFDRYYALMMELNTQEREHSFEDGFIIGVWMMEYAHNENLFERQE